MRATYGLLLVEFAAYVALFPFSNMTIDHLGFSTSGLLRGQFWTPLTSMFVHVDLYHLAFNLLFLYVFGTALEDKIGAKKTLGIFLVGGIESLFIGIPFYPADTRIVGASIAVSALLGAVMVLNPTVKSSVLLLYLPLGLVALIYVIFNLFMLIYDQGGGVAWPSHIIGFALGVVIGLSRRQREHHESLIHSGDSLTP